MSFAYPARRAGAEPVLRAVSIEPEPGRVTALLGPNGAGKTTLLRLMLGLLKPSSGSVTLDGRSIASMKEPQRARRLLYMSQGAELPFDFDMRTAVGLHAPGSGPAPSRETIERAIDALGLADRAGDPVGRLSAGQRQRAALARVLALAESRPEAAVLLADEPLSAQDPRHAGIVLDALRSMADRGLAVVVVLHDLTVASGFAADALLLDDRGSVVASGAASEVLATGPLQAAFGTPFTIGEVDGRSVVVAAH